MGCCFRKFEHLGCAGCEDLVCKSSKPTYVWDAAALPAGPVTLTHASDFDTNGVLYCIGTKGGTCKYQNPQKTGAVTVTASSKGRGGVYADRRLVQHQHDGKSNCTRDMPGSTMALALGGGVELEVAHYCLRHGNDCGAYRLRHWDLQASQDGRTWTTLRSHRDDQSLPDAAFSTMGWAVEGGKGTFSQFRIRQTGKNSNDEYDSLWCAGIELYGVLHSPQRIISVQAP